jgi:hypothetical protein
MSAPKPRKGMPSPKLDKSTFRDRFFGRFQDPAFRPYDADIQRIMDVAWSAYREGRKAPITRKRAQDLQILTTTSR